MKDSNFWLGAVFGGLAFDCALNAYGNLAHGTDGLQGLAYMAASGVFGYLSGRFLAAYFAKRFP